MSLFVKICGLTSEKGIAACVTAGADAVGFVFADSARRVAPRQAADLAAGLPDWVLKVAVFRRPERHEVERVLDVFSADLVQADHDTLPESPGSSVLPVYREGSGSVPEQGRRFIYEGPVSGVGRAVDLARAARLSRRGEMVLAGGLGVGNVAAAVRRVAPFGVDVSTGVESAPGVKDPALIDEFVVAARTAAERLVGT